MKLQLSLQINEKLALRDPESSALGKKIVREGLLLMHELGYEHFTFKKLAELISTTEASIYRYFENKHRFLLYLLTWYWQGLDFTIKMTIRNIEDPKICIKKVIEILCTPLPEWIEMRDLDANALYAVAVAESSKAYLTKEVDHINSFKLFMPYKSTCATIADIFKAYQPNYVFTHSLASTIVESAHDQLHFALHLPALTDLPLQSTEKVLLQFLDHLVFSVLDHP